MLKRIIFLTMILTSLSLAAPRQAAAEDGANEVLVVTADGIVAPAMLEYVQRSLEIAALQRPELVILQLDTPGGTISAMEDIVKEIRASEIPVVVYVAPRGAMAASAGTMITLAGHKAAMAPETFIGAAIPVTASGDIEDKDSKTKEKEALKAIVRSLSEARPPEAVAMAEDAIDHGKAVSSSEALEIGLIDYIAEDVSDLLRQLDGATVETADGMRTLNTQFLDITRVETSLIEQLLGILSNPNILFVLLNLGVLSILIEISYPGGWAAGFLGVVCLSLAVFGLGELPVNWFGMIFLLSSFVLFFMEIKAPVHGALAAAGTGSFIVGALVLFNSPGTPDFFRVSVPLVVTSGLITAAGFIALVTIAIRSSATPLRTGQETLLGQHGTARSELLPDKQGEVHLAGEW
ncbi:MAG: ATP-dependent Clp protease proteolytic subunit, partial [Anaerolineae bacterium]|nr:ATP-dependent Clp protease proteolytic subunit [Anaerolineae bacterium]